MREHYGLGKDLVASNIEKNLFGFRDDGREGLIVPTFPRIETKLSMAGSDQGDPDFADSVLKGLPESSFAGVNELKPPNSPPQPVFSINTIQEDT